MAKKTWRDYTEEQLLETGLSGNTDRIAQYNRIVTWRLKEAFVDQTNQLKDAIDKFNETSAKLSGRLYGLNWFIAVLTVALVGLAVVSFVKG
ncbi:hypothetical protein E3J38_09515 [candidate division TA06 bacterium]|uniref:Uncharacterized protein n=1 Tax=candidate division TA06 bacterium TaxID=2250710 RepID=A0A523XEP3_UNCT6|nr:MAG: hypothetical protein E3J38_09515 [candidate division TA06 bacterium]